MHAHSARACASSASQAATQQAQYRQAASTGQLPTLAANLPPGGTRHGVLGTTPARQSPEPLKALRDINHAGSPLKQCCSNFRKYSSSFSTTPTCSLIMANHYSRHAVQRGEGVSQQARATRAGGDCQQPLPPQHSRCAPCGPCTRAASGSTPNPSSTPPPLHLACTPVDAPAINSLPQGQAPAALAWLQGHCFLSTYAGPRL